MGTLDQSRLNVPSAGADARAAPTEPAKRAEIHPLSQWQLMWLRFRRSRPALAGAVILAIFYLGAIFAEFAAPYDLEHRFTDEIYAPPTVPHFVDAQGTVHLQPFVYKLDRKINPQTLQFSYTPDTKVRYPMTLFVRGDSYYFWGLFPTNLHLLGAEGDGRIFLLGTDSEGRDMLSRCLYGARVSLSVGLVGVFLTILLGSVLGVVSGYYGGIIDDGMQRWTELLLTIPQIPLWMALAAIVPVTWSPLAVYFGITIILSLLNWGSLARQIRGRTLALREEGYSLAAKSSGASDWWIITRHLLPNNASHIVVIATLSIPYMILGETALSFLGLGIRAPMTSWGVLLEEAQNITNIVFYPWLVAPAILVILAVLGFNFLGDGLRDAVDPYSR